MIVGFSSQTDQSDSIKCEQNEFNGKERDRYHITHEIDNDWNYIEAIVMSVLRWCGMFF